MIKYKTFLAEDFIDDDFFRLWVLHPTPESLVFWDQWIKENPEKAEVIHQAKSFLLAVNLTYGSETQLTDENVALEVKALLDGMTDHQTAPIYKTWYQTINWSRIAAAAVLVAGSVWWYTQKSDILVSKESQISQVADSLIKITNDSNELRAVFFSDGSVAILEKQSSVRFAKKFDGEVRTVYLDGEAFFDVAKNEKKPFLVYAHETVTRVVGTSFRIKAFEKDENIRVAVKTGKVAVYAQKDFKSSFDNSNAINLIPNEQAIFNRRDEMLQKGRVTNPEAISSKPDQQELVFDDTPVTQVFRTLGRSYHLNISFDEKLLSGCRITTQFKEENLKQRLEIICDAIDASYTAREGEILITSSGCAK